MFDILFGVGLHMASAGDVLDYEEPAAIHAKVKHEDYPVYGWGSLAKGEFFVLGQGTAKTLAPSVGLGITHSFTPKLSAFAEAGMTFNDLDQNMTVQQEIAYTYLVDRHNVPFRPIPVNISRPYEQDSYETTFEVDDPLVFKLGVNYEISDSWHVSTAYRFSKTRTLIEIYDEEQRASGSGWWMEEANTDTSAFEFQILYKW